MSAAPAGSPTALRIPAVDEHAGTMEAALAYVGEGLYIGPLRQGSKNPGSVLDVGHKRGNGEETWPTKTFADAETAVAHFSGTDYGMFLHCGRSGVVALDVDDPAKVPESWWPILETAPFQSTRAGEDRRGHYLFAVPAGRVISNATGTSRKGWGEVRGSNGVIVIAPTRHEKGSIGGRYAWVRTGEIPVLPALIADTLPEGKPGEAAVSDAEVDAFLAEHTVELAPKAYRDIPLLDFNRRVHERGESRHMSATTTACWLARNAAAGWYPAKAVFADLFDAFAPSFSANERKQGRGSRAEFLGIVAWAVGQVKPEDVAEKRAELDELLRQASVTVLPSPAAQPPTTPLTTATGGDPLADPDDGSDEEMRPTWARVDLDEILAGTYERPRPTVMRREDGVYLFYEGKVNALYGESESGKSWVMQWASAELLKAGQDVLYVDFEDDPGSIVHRLLDMGVPVQMVREHFDYRAPERTPASALEIDSWHDMLARPYKLAVIDGVTDSMGIFGKKINDNDEVGDWFRQFPTLLAKRTGAAVVLIDHVSKDSEHRGRFAIGAQHKLSSIKGAAYLVDVVDVLGVGRRGVMTLRVTKDRPGLVRGESGQQRKSDRTQETARFVLDSTGNRPVAQLTVFEAAPVDEKGEFRPTGVMQSVSELLEQRPDLSQTVVERDVRGRAEVVRQALTILEREGFVERRRVSATMHRWWSLKPYRQSGDPHAEGFAPAATVLSTASQARGEGSDDVPPWGVQEPESDRKSFGETPSSPQDFPVQPRPASESPVSSAQCPIRTTSSAFKDPDNPVQPRPDDNGTGLELDQQPRPAAPLPVGGGTGFVELQGEKSIKNPVPTPEGSSRHLAEDRSEADPVGEMLSRKLTDPCPCGSSPAEHRPAMLIKCRHCGKTWHALGHRCLPSCPHCPPPDDVTDGGDAA